jgi:hypothetical protein
MQGEGMNSKILVAVVALVALAVGFVATRAEGQAKGAVREQNVGRWQVVQGPPTGLYRTFLIDTMTGDTFIICGSKEEGIEGWCPMPLLKAASGRQQ